MNRQGQLTAETQATYDFGLAGANPPAISSTKAKTGSYSYRFDSNDDAISVIDSFAGQDFRAGAWINHNGISGIGILFRWRHTDNKVSTIVWDSTNIKYIYDGSVQTTITLSASGLNVLDTWIHIGVVYHSDGANGYVSFYVNGSQKIAFTGTVSPFATEVYVGGRSGATGWANYLYVDDFYVDVSVGEPDEAPPELRFIFAGVEDVGVDDEWTPNGAATNYECVDETPPDDETTYTSGDIAGLRDTFIMEEVVLPENAVVMAVIAQAYIKTDDLDTLAIYIDTHAYDGDYFDYGGGLSAEEFWSITWGRFEEKPGGGSWDQASINSSQFGYSTAE